MHARPMHLTGIPRQSRQGWSPWYITWSVTIVMGLGLTLLSPSTVQARTFQCRTGDVACLIASITQANAQPGNSHEIRLAAGVYTLTAVDNTTDWPNGLPSITSTLTIQGAGADTTILERPFNAPGFRLMHVAASGNLTLEGVTLSGGGSGCCGFVGSGGGLFNQGGTVRLVRTIVTRNFVAAYGAGLFNNGGTVQMMESFFTRNGTNAAAGGGIFAAGGTMTITQTTLADNHGDGGGGGIAIGPQAVVMLVDSTVVDNTTTGALGGGILNQGGQVQIMNSTVAYNESLHGGGLCNPDGTVVILNATFADNLGNDPAGLCVGGGTTTLQNTIIRNISDCASPITSLGYNLIADPSDFTITLQPSDLTGDPGLGPFTDTGEPGEQYFPLLSTSQAINAGNNTVCPKRDQLGEQRDKACDIGAIEFQGMAVSSW